MGGGGGGERGESKAHSLSAKTRSLEVGLTEAVSSAIFRVRQFYLFFDLQLEMSKNLFKCV